MGTLRLILAFLRAFVASRANLAAENVLLRQQLIVLQQSARRPQFRKRLWSGWRTSPTRART